MLKSGGSIHSLSTMTRVELGSPLERLSASFHDSGDRTDGLGVIEFASHQHEPPPAV